MQDVVANVSNHKFDVEFALEQQKGALPLPFSGMDKSRSAICTFYLQNLCSKGAMCPFRHTRRDRTVVCKHWLRGLCKKGDDCEFRHEFDMSKMPECYFYAKFGSCSNKECPFQHIDPESKVKDCPWYDRGFCRHGAQCKNRHVRRVMCVNYLVGFCPNGKECKHVHPTFDLPIMGDQKNKISIGHIVCHNCGDVGHKSNICSKPTNPQQVNVQRRPLQEVTCFKCGEKGHYANKCPKGNLAFLALSERGGGGGQGQNQGQGQTFSSNPQF